MTALREPSAKLDERSQNVLMAIVSSYIEMGGPVGSRTVVQRHDFQYSPATIRNIMADLEERGYLSQPHTSAGRVPTDLGYRFYVDQILETAARAEVVDEGSLFQRLAAVGHDLRELLAEATRMLSALSHCAGMVRSPRWADTIYRHAEFIRLNEHQVLVIFVTQEGVVQSRAIEVEAPLSQQALNRLAAWLNEELGGMPLHAVRQKLLQRLEEERALYRQYLDLLLQVSQEMLSARGEDDLYLGGTANILDFPEFADVERMKRLFQAFEEKYTLIHLLDKSMESEGVQVFIGSENPFAEMKECSVVTTAYKCGDRVVGTLGVLGPTRMDYVRVIPLVECTARLISRILSREGGTS